MPEETNITDDVILPPECVVEEKWFDRVAVVSAAGTVDMLTSPKLEERIAAALVQKPAALVVDLTDVEFLASAGMSVLIAANQQVPEGVRFATEIGRRRRHRRRIHNAGRGVEKAGGVVASETG